MAVRVRSAYARFMTKATGTQVASIQFTIDFGEPSGTLEEMGCEEFTDAQQIIDDLKRSGHCVARALEEWDLLTWGEVKVVFTPDIPQELQLQTVFTPGEALPFEEKEYLQRPEALRRWIDEHQSTATWSD